MSMPSHGLDNSAAVAQSEPIARDAKLNGAGFCFAAPPVSSFDRPSRRHPRMHRMHELWLAPMRLTGAKSRTGSYDIFRTGSAQIAIRRSIRTREQCMVAVRCGTTISRPAIRAASCTRRFPSPPADPTSVFRRCCATSRATRSSSPGGSRLSRTYATINRASAAECSASPHVHHADYRHCDFAHVTALNRFFYLHAWPRAGAFSGSLRHGRLATFSSVAGGLFDRAPRCPRLFTVFRLSVQTRP